MGKIPVNAVIEILAAQYGICHSRVPIDNLANPFTRLAGDFVELAATQRLLVEIGRRNIIPGQERVLLHKRYLRERPP